MEFNPAVINGSHMGARKRPAGRAGIVALVFAGLLFLPAAARCGDGLPAALARAEALGLWADPYWLTLGHYHEGKSRVDDPGFFLARNGKNDPKAELLATVKALYEAAGDRGESPGARFPARAAWIAERLGLDPKALPGGVSPRFEALFAEMAPVSVTLAFAASSMNSPASMFGHTLLVADTASGTRLSARAVNYAALTTDSFGFTYAAKGIFGLYRGYYSMMPYHEKIKEYSDMAHRDLWEYPLNLSPAEIRRLFAHLYEMNGVFSDYYFADENCSLGLLYLLDAARPGLRLVDKASFWVLPVDTVRLVRASGLAGEPVLRPSLTEKIRRRARGLLGPSRRLALSVARGRAEAGIVLSDKGMTEAEKAEALDLAAEAAGYFLSAGSLEKDRYVPRFRAILSARSSLPTPEKPAGAEAAEVPPDAGHRASMVSLGAGSEEGRGFCAVSLRAAGHGLMDPRAGYPAGSRVVVGQADVDIFTDGSGARLFRLDLLDILSLAPRDGVFAPVSWGFWTGFTRATDEDGGSPLVWGLAIEKGLSWELPAIGLCYILAGAEADAGSGLARSHAVGVTAEGGVLRSLGKRLTLNVSARAAHFALGDVHERTDISAGLSFFPTPGAALTAEFGTGSQHGFSTARTALSFKVYF